jgi:hypothetical protein
MTSAHHSYCGPVITDTQSYGTFKQFLIRFLSWHFISWLGKHGRWRILLCWQRQSSHQERREIMSLVTWKSWLCTTAVLIIWLFCDSCMTTVKAYFPTWLIFIGSRPCVYNPYLGLLSLLFLGTSLAIFILKISNGQYVVTVQLFSSEKAFHSTTL